VRSGELSTVTGLAHILSHHVSHLSHTLRVSVSLSQFVVSCECSAWWKDLQSFWKSMWCFIKGRKG